MIPGSGICDHKAIFDFVCFSGSNLCLAMVKDGAPEEACHTKSGALALVLPGVKPMCTKYPVQQ